MKAFVDIVLKIIYVISITGMFLFGAFTICADIMPAYAEKLLKALHIPLSYNQSLIAGFVFTVLAVTTHIIIRRK